MIAKKTRRPYIVVFEDEISGLGLEAAALLAKLRLLSKRFKKDDHGYFQVFGSYLYEQLGLPKRTFVRLRQQLVDAHKIDYIPGKNQNVKSRYKILL